MATPEDITDFQDEVSDTISSASNSVEDPGYLPSLENILPPLNWNNWMQGRNFASTLAFSHVLFEESLVAAEVVARHDELDTASNWMEDPSFSASGGEDPESSASLAYNTRDYQNEPNLANSQFSVRNTGADGNDIFDSTLMDRVKCKYIDKNNDINQLKGSTNCQESDHGSFVCIHKPETAEEEPVINIARSRQLTRFFKVQAQLYNNTQYLRVFTYPLHEVDGNHQIIPDTIQPATMIVPSGAYYNINHHTPMLFPTFHNPVSENLYFRENQFFNADDAYSFGEISEILDHSDESDSLQRDIESSINVEETESSINVEETDENNE